MEISKFTLLRLLLIIMSQSLFSCNERPSFLSKSRLIEPQYRKRVPIASIVNMGNGKTLKKDFYLKSKTGVKIYSTGEMNISLSEVPRFYFLKNDDIEIFFYPIKPNGEIDSIRKVTYLFSWGDGCPKGNTISFYKYQAKYKSIYNIYEKKYSTTITIPIKSLINQYRNCEMRSIGLNLAIGDNDDNKMQKAKVVWKGNQDPLLGKNYKYNSVYIGRHSLSTKAAYLSKNRDTETLDKSIFDKRIPIDNISFGIIKDSTDLSASFVLKRLKDSICFEFEIRDSRKGIAHRSNFFSMDTFHDYGWIEDVEGNVVWKMNAIYSKYAGGAYKNQFIDTSIFLNSGKYSLHYITDESHSWRKWDDRSPFSDFYGIILFNKKTN